MTEGAFTWALVARTLETIFGVGHPSPFALRQVSHGQEARVTNAVHGSLTPTAFLARGPHKSNSTGQPHCP
ncbi:hypothetical protein CEXT_300391 [Caerostris extrusa]|uniref:Uncharacterized protein n=1 Tax=Caerostris extrusa TaxID=172846 RepID=A0AAV4NXX3_CAEEX|nr:hypothetical protein CEXT_300391 [Caerostris extrusa]